ncbi:hypothetical protein AGR4C_pc30021 [Agrobacterium tumefaciens str. Kerr 14]|uniref:Uncharacterized protein n=1 Tax=Agrobacterium tumefaciens str. Kerr 14 TaxID=1183424 RepID=A0A1S7SFU2_AGRTU|nr:hypothetical protein AGR4C_pc30021 [Agrobacterium tumefaciens str. Kerr 14]
MAGGCLFLDHRNTCRIAYTIEPVREWIFPAEERLGWPCCARASGPPQRRRKKKGPSENRGPLRCEGQNLQRGTAGAMETGRRPSCASAVGLMSKFCAMCKQILCSAAMQEQRGWRLTSDLSCGFRAGRYSIPAWCDERVHATRQSQMAAAFIRQQDRDHPITEEEQDDRDQDRRGPELMLDRDKAAMRIEDFHPFAISGIYGKNQSEPDGHEDEEFDQAQDRDF